MEEKLERVTAVMAAADCNTVNPAAYCNTDTAQDKVRPGGFRLVPSK